MLTLSGNASHVTYVRRSGDVTAKDLSLRGAEGEQLQVAAAHGNPNQKVAVASGGAHLSNADGLTATGPSFDLQVDAQGTRWLTTDGGVEVRGPGMEISAPTLRANLDEQRVSFSSGVSTRLSAP